MTGAEIRALKKAAAKKAGEAAMDVFGHRHHNSYCSLCCSQWSKHLAHLLGVHELLGREQNALTSVCAQVNLN